MDGTLLTGLREALTGLVRRPEGAPDVGACLDTIERLAGELGGTVPAQLRHYLTNRSYEKALLFLEGREAENRRGSCA